MESCPREEDPKARTHEEIDVCIRPNMAVDDDIPAKRDITKLPTAAISDTTMKEKGEREERAILTEAEDHSESGEKSLQDQGIICPLKLWTSATMRPHKLLSTEEFCILVQA